MTETREATDLDARYLAACAVAREAGVIMRRRFFDRESLQHSFKGPHDYLSAVDGEVERLVFGRLTTAFPGDAVLGEETGGAVGRRTWVVDPIDGTANFVRGIPHFCISIALVVDGQIEVGVIYNPVTEEMFAARRGGGATLNGVPMQASKLADPHVCSVEIGWSTRRTMADYLALIGRVTAMGCSFRRSGSGALGIAYVADGRSDGYCELHINAWDCLAGLLMVTEAGGWTNDFLANNGMHAGNPVLACGPRIREALIAATGIA